MSDYEPPAEMVDALRQEIRADAVEFGLVSQRLARFVLRRQHEREKPLLVAMEKAHTSLDGGYDHPSWGREYLKEALAAHAKLDAPKVPTLLEAAANIAASAFKTSLSGACADKDTFIGISLDRLKALKAAVEREERK